VSETRRDRRSEVLDFVERFWDSHGYAPTFDEIRRATGLSSKSHVLYYLGVLERDGLVERRSINSPRGVRPASVSNPKVARELQDRTQQKL
jgi:SOS-response transcriptional repressor LexA